MKQYLMPYLARLISSNGALELKRSFAEVKRKIKHAPHELEIFLHINDPYSYILVQVLPDIQRRFNIKLRLRTIYQFDAEMFPEYEMWKKNAFYDALRLAELYNLKAPKQPPKADNLTTINYTYLLVNAESSNKPIEQFCTLFDQYWGNGSVSNGSLTNEKKPNKLNNKPFDSALRINETRLKQLGHYMSGMVYYAGEWYWGVDRLDHFEKRANRLMLSNDIPPTVLYNRTYSNFCQNEVNTTNCADRTQQAALTLYFSIRSPYSHIGLERAIVLAKHYNIELIVKPVLPMVMRGLSVPNAKKMYIFHDTKREALKHDIDYGCVADPLGQGVERCYALFNYAASEDKAIEFLLAYARAVNAQGIRSETDRGLKQILLSCGLDWHKAHPLLKNTDWKDWAEKNLQEMYDYGLWGVPSYRYKSINVWGQDRLFIIENEIIKVNSKLL